ncbi:MAG: ATP-binding protein, partial [Proteobacteria bacterium]|nr:ATP-binding protein [Pseudomonadota bacterium]
RLLTQSLRSELARDHDRLQEKEAELLQRIHREQELLLDKQQSDDKLQIAIEEKLLLLDAVSEGILGINIDGKITFVNSAAIKLLALEESALIYEHVLDIVCRSTTKVGLEAETRKILQDCIENGTSNQGVKGIFAGGENVLLPVTFSSRPIKKGDKLIGVVLSFTDDSRQKEIESKLIQSQKMEAMGRITGGVAHDFNNLLTVIIGNLQFLRRRYFDSGKGNAGELVEKILTAAKSGAELNNRLLSFSREQSLHNEPVDLVILLGEMREFVQRILGEEISVHLRIEDSPAIAMLDRTQFENVIVNLCLNAKDAMPDGGDLIISGSHTVLTESPVLSAVNSRHSHGEKDYYELSITDTGCGIPVEIQSKVFDPFFTTKPKGEGSGFGLSTAFGFMQQSGGTIKLSSQVGKGTTFTLQLPLAKDAELEDSIRATDQAEGMYNGKVLVVEDDAAVRDVASQTLLDAGYEIIQAVDGRQGLEKFKAHPDIDLVFSDIVMPGGLTGIEMAQTIQQLRPVPVLLATGYTEKMLKDRIESQRNILCISKPYDTDELPSLINSMMTKEAS